ncbi:hypothetical protein, partial [Rhizobium sp. PDO1-076]|uniref:hypothetical protein n=1 Tax=Rhizobium sp. PDO1-076 TaxID=1125979 RepID=UPI001AEBE6E0
MNLIRFPLDHVGEPGFGSLFLMHAAIAKLHTFGRHALVVILSTGMSDGYVVLPGTPSGGFGTLR